MRRLPVVALAGCAVVTSIAAPLAHADTQVYDSTFFRSPSGNIGCLIAPASAHYTARDYVRCDIREHTWSAPPKPSTCPDYTGWGSGLELEAGQPAGIVCAGDTTFGGGSALGYGASISAGVVRCTSAQSGMRCTDTQTGHGFTLARQDFQLF